MRLALVLALLPLVASSAAEAALHPPAARAAGGAATAAAAHRLVLPPLRINELLAGPARDWDGSGTFSSRDDEWVEVMNPGGVPTDLTGYFITDGDSIPRYAFTGTLASGERLLVTGRASYDWERATGHPAFGLSLSNTGDQVMLWKVTGPETLLVDSYKYASHEAAADRAAGRIDDGETWGLFDGLNPYTGTAPPHGTGCEPTPAAGNACLNTPVLPVSWGRMKAIYRTPPAP